MASITSISMTALRVSGILCLCLAPISLRAQERQSPSDSVAAGQDSAWPPGDPVLIDTVLIQRQDVFSEEDAAGSFIFRTMNSLHVVTRPFVIRRELLLGSGEHYDSAQAAESERNLRRRLLFSQVEIDTIRVENERLAMRVRTEDAWSTTPKFEFALASDGTLTGSLGVTESNLFGTGNYLLLWYTKLVDRDGIQTGLGLNRFLGSSVFVGGSYQSLSDLKAGTWRIGRPFYASEDTWSVDYAGEAFDGRAIRYRTEVPAVTDTTFFGRTAMIHRASAAFAPIAGPRGYLRVGVTGEIRQEEYFDLDAPEALVPDSLYGLVGAFLEYRRTEFQVLRYFNGFNREDQDLSERIFVSAQLAPESWGYPSTGIGARLLASAGAQFGDSFLKGFVDANALFNAAGLDSGQVVARATAGLKPAPKHALVLQVFGGIHENPPPGREFDLGFQIPPRLWSPHSFTGTRTFRTVLEHRWFVFDELFRVVGAGIGGFLDYGGAWFDDQDPRFGGNIGLSVFFGSRLNAGTQRGNVNIGYRFSEERLVGTPWVLSLGTGLRF